ncbi:MAG: hypothetical protein WA821_11670 [Anaerolineales bacterium]
MLIIYFLDTDQNACQKAKEKVNANNTGKGNTLNLIQPMKASRVTTDENGAVHIWQIAFK